MLVTALKANKEVLKMETVAERLLHAERKEKEHSDYSEEKAMATRQHYSRNGTKCHQFEKFCHIKRNCRSFPEQRKSVNHDKVKAYGYKYKANASEPRSEERIP